MTPLLHQTPMPSIIVEGELASLTAWAAPAPSQSERIRQWAQRAYKARNAYSTKTAAKVTAVLANAEKEVKAALLHYTTLGDLPEGKLANQRSLRRLQAEIRAIIAQVREKHRLILKQASTESFKRGISHGIEEFVQAQLPFYKELDDKDIDKMATNVFTIIDAAALDFMTHFNVQLAGDESRQLADGINRTIQAGIATGMSVRDIVKEMGAVVTDKEAFRRAGKKVFGKAQTRMELIARTETIRAHSQGQRKFYAAVGVRKLEWLTMDDERLCPKCEPLDGKRFRIDRFPNQPKHPNCRCGHTAVIDLPVCGSQKLGAKAAAGSPGCILSPQDVEAQAQKVKADEAAAQKAWETGSFDGLTAKQAQIAAKQHGVSIARTKADFIKLLDQAEPGVDHSTLAGKELKAKIVEHKIGLLRTKQELIDLLKAKHAAEAQHAAVETMTPPQTGYEGLTVKQLQQIAKEKGVSLHMTKQDVIDVLDQLEPGVDHSGLSGQALAAAKKKHGIGALKNKQQLIDALNKHAAQQAAEQAKKQAEQAQLAAKMKQAKDALVAKTSAVHAPADPADYGKFLEAVKAAEEQIGQSGILPQDTVEIHAKEVALKKQLFQQQIASMSGGELKKLAQKTKVHHYQWASKGDLVALFTETDPAKVQAAKDSIEAKWAKWAEKHGSKKGKAKAPAAPKPAPAPKPKPAPPAPSPQPPTPATPQPSKATAPVFTKKGSEFDAVDEAWKTKGQPKNFKFLGKADIEGAHTKYFYLDENGDKWLFKPVHEEFRAHGDEVAYRIGRLIDPEAIEVRVITLDGKVGSIQKWKTGLAAKKDFAGVDPADLSPAEIAQIQREHVIDWLISNHDGHGKQFLRMQDGRVYGIDKGQLFKFLGEDKLSIDYHPNRVHGESEPYYNTLFRAAKQGKVKFDPADTLRYIREVEKIDDDHYRELLAPYAERRFGNDRVKKEAFYQAALERKRNIRRDFERFYADILGQPGFRFEEAEAPKAPEKGLRLGKAEIDMLEEAKAAGWQGKVIPFDVDDVEDQNALVFVETAGGKPRTVVRMKIRPEAESKLLRNLAVTSDDRLTVEVGETLPQDTYYEKILAGVKTVNSHIDKGDFDYNKSTLDEVKKIAPKLEKLKKSKDPDEAAMAAQYLADCEKVLQGAATNTKYSGLFTQYRKQFESKPDREKPAEGITARKTKVHMVKRQIRNGQLIAVQDKASIGEVFQRRMKDGVQYEIDLGGGMKATYKPWVGANYYAQQGELEIYLPGDADPKQFDEMMARLEQMGITAAIATPEDAELMYLQKQAYILKVDKQKSYTNMMRELDQRGASKQERIARLRRFWERRLGVEDITKLPGYNPMGEHQMQWNDPQRRAGYRHQMRFDISDEDLEREMKDYALYHRLTDDSSLPDFIDMVLENNGAMVSTVEKMRMGIPPGGMSPEADMGTGGAAYFFTRIRKKPTSGGFGQSGLYFKKRMLRRMDAITYAGDKYGRVTDDTVRRHRKSTITDWKRIASKEGSDETIFKYSVTLLDNIDVIQAKSASERERIIKAFKKHGVDRLPDGRKVEEIVIS